MVYLSCLTTRCINKLHFLEEAQTGSYEQCAQVFVPQFSICFFLLAVACSKVIIAPLSKISITSNDIVKLNVPRRFVFQGILTGISFLLNLCLFSSMEEGPIESSTVLIVGIALVTIAIPLVLEFIYMFNLGGHRTSLAGLASQSSIVSSTNLNNPPSTSLALTWRLTFLCVGFTSPFYYFMYATTGEEWYDVMGYASLTPCASSMILYTFASLDP